MTEGKRLASLINFAIPFKAPTFKIQLVEYYYEVTEISINLGQWEC